MMVKECMFPVKVTIFAKSQHRLFPKNKTQQYPRSIYITIYFTSPLFIIYSPTITAYMPGKEKREKPHKQYRRTQKGKGFITARERRNLPWPHGTQYPASLK